MSERGMLRQVEILKNPTETLEAVLTDAEFDTAVEHMLAETGEYDAIVDAMANVAERHGASVKDMNTAIRIRFTLAGRELESTPGAQ